MIGFHRSFVFTIHQDTPSAPRLRHSDIYFDVCVYDVLVFTAYEVGTVARRLRLFVSFDGGEAQPGMVP